MRVDLTPPFYRLESGPKGGPRGELAHPPALASTADLRPRYRLAVVGASVVIGLLLLVALPELSGTLPRALGQGAGHGMLVPEASRTALDPRLASSVRAPGPFAIPERARDLTGGQYYAGSVYEGAPRNVSSVNVTVSVPDDVPQRSDYYFVLLSTWDNSGSYDQFGFTNDYGAWGLAYSTTSYCLGSYSYNPNATPLSRGATYEFEMTIGAGNVTFEAAREVGRSLTTVFSLKVETGGSEFELAPFYACSSGSYYDYTDFEEVYTTSAPLPPYDFFFTGNGADAAAVTDWTNFSSGTPTTVDVLMAGANTTVANEPYYLSFGAAGDSTTVAGGTAPRAFSWNVSVDDLSPDAPIDLGNYSLPVGWTLTLTPAAGDPPFTARASGSIGSDVAPGSYLIGFEGSDGSGTYSRIALAVNLSDGGFGVSLSATPEAVDLGQSVSFTASADGGAAPYSYVWAGLPPGCAGENASTVACVPSTTGTFEVSVAVTDSDRTTESSGALVLVISSDPHESTVLASRGSADAGQTVTFRANISGGSGGGSYVWSSTLRDCPPSVTSTLTCTSSAAGSFNVSYLWTDSNGVLATGNGSRAFDVYALPAVTAPSPSRSGGEVGQAVSFSAAVIDVGSGADVYAWTVAPKSGLGCSSSVSLTLDCQPLNPGTYGVTVLITDSNYGSSNMTTSFGVVAKVAISSFGASPSPLPMGSTVILTVATAGGRAPFSYAYSDLPTGCLTANSSTITCTPSANGTYQVAVVVTDADGARAEANTSVTVGGATQVSPPAGTDPWLAGCLAAGLCAVAGTAGALRRRDRRHFHRPSQGRPLEGWTPPSRPP